jgi:signal peptidase II
MIDRFFRPDLGVVDFIEPMFVDFAIFNVADSFLTVGAILLAIHTIFVPDKTKEKKEEVKEETVND